MRRATRRQRDRTGEGKDGTRTLIFRLARKSGEQDNALGGVRGGAETPPVTPHSDDLAILIFPLRKYPRPCLIRSKLVRFRLFVFASWRTRRECPIEGPRVLRPTGENSNSSDVSSTWVAVARGFPEVVSGARELSLFELRSLAFRNRFFACSSFVRRLFFSLFTQVFPFPEALPICSLSPPRRARRSAISPLDQFFLFILLSRFFISFPAVCSNFSSLLFPHSTHSPLPIISRPSVRPFELLSSLS